jgi:hypothetical protein
VTGHQLELLVPVTQLDVAVVVPLYQVPPMGTE